MTRDIGDQWLVSQRGALLKVPSAVMPHSFNYLFNPRHELATGAKIINTYRYSYDNRLFQTTNS